MLANVNKKICTARVCAFREEERRADIAVAKDAGSFCRNFFLSEIIKKKVKEC